METLELIIVLSKGMLDKYEAKDASSKGERFKPLLERYESVYKTLQTLYELVNLRIIMLDIIVWEEDQIDIGNQENTSDDILNKFKAWTQESDFLWFVSNNNFVEK